MTDSPDDKSQLESPARRRVLRGALATGAGLAMNAAAVPMLASDLHDAALYETMPPCDPPPANIRHTANETYTSMARALTAWHHIDRGVNITENPMKVTLRDGEHSYLCVLPGTQENVSCWCDDMTGTKILALREVNPHKDPEDNSYHPVDDKLHMICLGRHRKVGEMYGGNIQDISTTVDLIDGKRSPQIAPTDRYYDEILKPYLDKNPDLDVHVFGESQGSGNALHLKYRLQQDAPGRIPETTIYEPFAPTQEVINIVRDCCGDYKGDCPDAQKGRALAVLKDLRRGITSIRAVPATAVARCVNGASEVNNKQFAENILLLDARLDPDHKIANIRRGEIEGAAAAAATLPTALHYADTHRSTRRKFFRDMFNVAGAATIGAGVGSKAVTVTDMTYHTMDRPFEILTRFGADALAKPKDTHHFNASDQEILAPSKYRPDELINIAVSDVFNKHEKNVLADLRKNQRNNLGR